MSVCHCCVSVVVGHLPRVGHTWVSSSSALPAISLGFTILGEIFAYLIMEVVTFCLRGCCMLGVFLLLAFTCLGNECQDLLGLCNGRRVHRRDLSLHFHLK